MPNNDEILQCDHLIVATGSEPAKIPIPGIDLSGVVDSTGLLNITTCPKHIIIVSGGVIGIEFATFFYRLGVKITVVSILDRVLGPLDKDTTDFVEVELKTNGVDLVLGVKVQSIKEGLKVNYISLMDGIEGSIEGDVVLIPGGRVSNSCDTGLEEIDAKLDSKEFVENDDFFCTNAPDVYAIGDINGKMQLAHVTSAQGILAANHIARKTCKQLNLNRIPSHPIPSCVYCNPETAMVGLAEEQARATGCDIGTGLFNLAGNGKTSMGENKGFVKSVFNTTTDEILKFHVIGPRATDLAAEVAAVMECEGTISAIYSTVHTHPTVSEVVMEAAHVCHGCCGNEPKARK